MGLLLQVVLAFAVGDEPVRFGAPVPEAVLERGLALEGPGRLSWRRLPLEPRRRWCWVEVALAGAHGRVRLRLGGDGRGAERDPAVVVARTPADSLSTTEWRWADGGVDWRRRRRIDREELAMGELFAAGEYWTEEAPALATRAAPVLTLPRRTWVDIGLLPRDEGLARPVREHLQRAAHALVELPGVRGRGDHARSGDVVTNLEFDTTLALLRLALALGDHELLQRARRAAWHLVDRDLDVATGLPFGHGQGHRDTAPEPGHVWLQGLLWVGAVTAEDELLAGAAQIASALALRPPAGEGADERARGFAWPLLELEAWLTVRDDRRVARAADAIAVAIAARFDAAAGTFVFGEGAVRGPGMLERGWITGGVVVPALQAHLRRRPDARLAAIVAKAVATLVARIGNGRDGLPTHWRVLGSAAFAEHRAVRDPKAFLLLEALPPPELRRLLGRSHVLAGLLETPSLDDPDLPTSLAMAARCTWVYR